MELLIRLAQRISILMTAYWNILIVKNMNWSKMAFGPVLFMKKHFGITISIH